MYNLYHEFKDSYIQAISGMDLNNVTPWTETEIQPQYCSLWVDNVINKYLNLDPKLINGFTNISVLRSMLVMDMMDCTFSANKKLKLEVFDWYVQLLQEYYPMDIFSTTTNLHVKTPTKEIKDWLYFKQTDINIVKILNKAFQICYKKHHDIYADNGYEVLGPIYTSNSTSVIYKFHNILEYEIQIISEATSKIPGYVDLFGHCNIATNPCVLIYNNDIVDDTKLFLENLNKLEADLLYNKTIPYHIQQRVNRYKNWLDIPPSEFFSNNIVCTNNRITNINTLKELI